ncbi:sugar 3,4-ketoisomerase [Mycobacterium sp.]|uniref:sugar 3,4-ketoisomerase n=1 Tax=Mycobacterium sp. TaxID=1785 RepID=UPI003BB1E195
MSSVDECRLVNLEKIEMPEGNLSPLYGGVHVPFEIKRVFYLYDVPGGAERGGHAHRVLQQFIVAASGSFAVMLDDGRSQRTVSLDRSYHGLYVPSMIWTQVTGFCTGAISLVFASLAYEESDYIRDYEDFITTARSAASTAG